MWSFEPHHTQDTLETVQRKLAVGEAVLWDVREQDEWDQGHLQAATLMPLSILTKEFRDGTLAPRLHRQVPADKIVYCHCRAGVRVLTAANVLNALGYDVRPLEAGYAALLNLGFVPSAPAG